MSASQQKKLRQQQREQGLDKRQLEKQKAEKAAKKTKAITTVVWVVVVLALIVAILFSSNLFYHAFPAVTLTSAASSGPDGQGGASAAVASDDVSFNASELSFYYKSGYYNFIQTNADYLQYFGLDTSKSLSSQPYGEDGTWADYFMESAITSMTEVTAMCAEAEKAGFQLSEEKKAALESEFTTLETTAKNANFNSVSAYLTASYGKGCNEKIVRGILEKTYLAQAYMEEMYNSFTYTDSELAAYYEENKDNYDSYSFISYFADGAENTDEGIDSETAMANAKTLADSIIDGVATEDEFIQAVKDKAEADVSSVSSQGSGLSSTYGDWLKDSSRKAGDMTVVSSDTGYYAVYFISRERSDGPTVSARHILTYVLPDANGEYTDEAKAEAKAKAEDILATWKAGDATEESFAALANANSEDTGSNTNGGLYENFREGAMVEEFSDWCFDPSRKPGDTGIVFNEGSYCGYHVIYFVGEGETYDKVISEQDLRSADYNEWKTSVTEGYTSKTTFTAKLVK